jgi:four helix bundle protein
MSFGFQQLDTWQLALDYINSMSELAEQFPVDEPLNLKPQLTRAAVLIAANVAASTMERIDSERDRILGLALQSLMETVVCQNMSTRRGYILDRGYMAKLNSQAEQLANGVIAMRSR